MTTESHATPQAGKLRRLMLDKHLVEVAIGALAGLSMRGLEIGGKFVFQILIALKLGADNTGLFFLCMSLQLWVCTLARLGMDRAMTRYVAAEMAVGNHGLVRRIVVMGMGWICLASFGFAAILYLKADWISHAIFHKDHFAPALQAIALACPAYAILQAMGAVLSGFKKTLSAQFFASALWPVLVAIGFLTLPLSLELALHILLYAMSIATILAAIILARVLANLPETYERHHLPGLFRTGLPLLVVEVIQVTLISMPTLLLAVHATASEVGVFSLSNRFAILIWTMVIAVSGIAAPKFAECHRLGDHAGLQATLVSTARIVRFTTFPILAIFFIAPELLLRWMGSEFAEGATLLRIMALAQIVNACFPCFDSLLAMTGHGKHLRSINLIVLMLSVVACAVLIPLYGMVGAAIATAITLVSNAILPVIVAARILPVSLWPLLPFSRLWRRTQPPDSARF